MTLKELDITPQKIIEVRSNMNMTQYEFANAIGISPRTLQGWEQGRRTPTRTAQVLLSLMIQHPEKVMSVIKKPL